MTLFCFPWRKSAVSAKSLLILFCSGLLFACKTGIGPNSSEAVPGNVTRNISYGPLPRQVVDIAVPATISPQTPWVLMLHGGSWKYGNKTWVESIRQMLYEKGIASVNMNYRLANETTSYREQIEDLTLAVAKMRQTMLRFGNKGKYFLLGESAGGHLALLYGYQHPQEVAGLISLSSPTDFYTEHYFNNIFFKRSRSVIEQITGARFDNPSDTAVFKEASPLAHISPVPTLVFQGDKDLVVDSSQGMTLARELENKNVPYKLVLMHGAGHVPRLLPWKRPAIYREIFSWIFANAPDSSKNPFKENNRASQSHSSQIRP